MPKDYLVLLNQPVTNAEIEKLERSEEKNVPFGGDEWIHKVVQKFDIEQVLRRVGRPRNSG